jgi:hypothetical protein
MKTKEKNTNTTVDTYMLYRPQTQQLVFIRHGKITGGLAGDVAEKAFARHLEGEMEIRIAR